MNNLYILIAVLPISLGVLYALYGFGKYLKIDYDKMIDLEKKIKEYENDSKSNNKYTTK